MLLPFHQPKYSEQGVSSGACTLGRLRTLLHYSNIRIVILHHHYHRTANMQDGHTALILASRFGHLWAIPFLTTLPSIDLTCQDEVIDVLANMRKKHNTKGNFLYFPARPCLVVVDSFLFGQLCRAPCTHSKGTARSCGRLDAAIATL